MNLIFRMKKFPVHDAFQNKCNKIDISWNREGVPKLPNSLN